MSTFLTLPAALGQLAELRQIAGPTVRSAVGTLAPKTSKELEALDQAPPAGSAMEDIGRAARAFYLQQFARPREMGESALAGAMMAGDELRKGLGVQPASPRQAKPTPSNPLPPSPQGTPQAPADEEEVITYSPKSPIRAFKDASGKLTFTNQTEDPAGLKEVDYAAATASLRPAGKGPGGVSFPTAVDDQGRPTMVPDVETQRSRQQELEQLSHAAITRRLKGEIDPQLKLQEDMATAKQLADALQPSPEAQKARVEATYQAAVEAAKAQGQKVDAAALRRLIEQDAENAAARQRQEALQALLLMQRFPGQTLSGYGQMERYANDPLAR